jgi:hypothetical protein
MNISDEHALKIASDFALECWERFVRVGGIERVAEDLGPMGEYEGRIFEAGWKLGFTQCLLQGRAFSDLRDDSPNPN